LDQPTPYTYTNTLQRRKHTFYYKGTIDLAEECAV
jgi:hypothetical protein